MKLIFILVVLLIILFILKKQKTTTPEPQSQPCQKPKFTDVATQTNIYARKFSEMIDVLSQMDLSGPSDSKWVKNISGLKSLLDGDIFTIEDVSQNPDFSWNNVLNIVSMFYTMNILVLNIIDQVKEQYEDTPFKKKILEYEEEVKEFERFLSDTICMCRK
ncbi:011L [Cherax quadricarinatus iridovirus]|uniref:Uncharacterized protein n=1 Tax=Shrimp hemocyte iridescent virus TaxID=2039780 RepID=A0A291B0Y0_9VIRU|nr:011L [Cherax quadricarinatus iridovirus]YP_010084891.1 hypothetical protein KM509_gp139 [Shrimp hemocyte iridescent virus]UPA43331.1 hypothetical protein 4TH000057 [Iridovirus CN01]ASZ84991.1 011L [Cherax quadricarinatus iridovirus]ATE87148.1 hypothetical protein [Shrimp hemocyte iridescent virus]UPA43566.1 hypothetical protein 3TG000133 [Iridovirus CN01]UPA43601.1 hypothetical protein 1DG000009 [Iridovirus CN01]